MYSTTGKSSGEVVLKKITPGKYSKIEYKRGFIIFFIILGINVENFFV